MLTRPIIRWTWSSSDVYSTFRPKSPGPSIVDRCCSNQVNQVNVDTPQSFNNSVGGGRQNEIFHIWYTVTQLGECGEHQLLRLGRPTRSFYWSAASSIAQRERFSYPRARYAQRRELSTTVLILLDELIISDASDSTQARKTSQRAQRAHANRPAHQALSASV